MQNSKFLMKILRKTLIIGFITLDFSVSAQLPRLILNEVYVDYAVGVDNPLIKTRFNVYDPVGPAMEQFDQNVKIMNELNIETYRIELGWGRRYSGFGLNRMIGGTPGNLIYDFKPLDHMVTELKKQNVLLHGAYEGVDLYDQGRDAVSPWGTRKKADEIIYISDLAEFQIPLKENAPGGWKGKAHISFIMQNTGAGTRAKIVLL